MEQLNLASFDSSQYNCPICDRTFDSKNALRGHHNSVHGENLLKNEEILDDLRHVDEMVAGSPTASDYREYGEYGMSTIYRRFDSFESARQRAGVNGEVYSSKRINKEELLEDLRRVNELVDGAPKSTDYLEHGKYSLEPIKTWFDSFRKGREAAGVDGEIIRSDEVTKQEIINEVRNLSDELGRTPLAKDMRDMGKYSTPTCYNWFDSWEDIIKESGLEYNDWRSTPDIDREELKEDLLRVKDIVGNPPTIEQYKKHGNYGWSTLQREAGSWNNVLKWVGLTPNERRRQEVPCDNCGTTLLRKPSHIENYDHQFCNNECYGEWRSENIRGEDHTQFKPGWTGNYGPNWDEQRNKARRRDNFSCQDCGMKEDEHIKRYDIELHVHHRIPIREFTEEGEVDYQAANRLPNLITFCQFCHSKWESLPVQPKRG